MVRQLAVVALPGVQRHRVKGPERASVLGPPSPAEVTERSAQAVAYLEFAIEHHGTTSAALNITKRTPDMRGAVDLLPSRV